MRPTVPACAIVWLAAAIVGVGTEPAIAQQGTSAGATPPSSVSSPVDVSRLPLNLSRIQRRLQASSERQTSDGLKLRFFVDVYGEAPPIVLFSKEDNLQTGPVPYGAPTHRQVIDAITPQPFRAPAADLGSLFRWLSDKSK